MSSAVGMAQARGRPGRLWDQPVYLRVAWVLLLILSAFPVAASAADLVGIGKTGLPADHAAAFASVAGATWIAAKAASPGVASYVTLLEYGYAVHEFVFGLLFLLIVAVPVRRGATWAWFACWTVLIADIGYSLTFGRYDLTLLRQSLIADISLPILLLVQIRRFFAAGSQNGRL